MNPLRLLIIGARADLAALLTAELQRAGFDPDTECISDHRSLPDPPARHQPDLILVTDAPNGQPLPDFVSEIAGVEDNPPVIVICSRETEAAALAAMDAGARDVVFRDRLARLGPAVNREIGKNAAEFVKDETSFRQALDEHIEFFVRWTPDGIRTFVNRTYREFFGGSAKKLTGTSFLDEMGERAQSFINEFLVGLMPENPVATAEHRFTTADGTAMIHEWVNRGIFDDSGALVEIQSVGRDITKQRRAEETERQRTLLVEVLRDTASALNSTLDADEVFDRILAAMAWVIPHHASAIFYVENDTANVIKLAGWQELGIDDIPGTIPLNENEAAFLSSMAATGKPVVIQDTAEDPIWEPGLRRLDWVRSFAAAPLFDESKVFGVLALFCNRPDYFTAMHIELLEGFASQAASASRNARLFETVSESRHRLRELAIRIVDAQEDERRKISRELHDGVAQTLTGVIINTELLMAQSAGKGDSPNAERLEKITDLARQSLDQIRSLSHRLRPAMLDELGLVPTLRWFTKRFADWSEVDVELSFVGMDDERLEPSTETALYRVVQEFLAAAGRLDGTDRFEIELRRTEDAAILRVGSIRKAAGAEITLPGDEGEDLELLGIRERVLAIGGKLTIESPPGHGLTLGIRVPISPPGS